MEAYNVEHDEIPTVGINEYIQRVEKYIEDLKKTPNAPWTLMMLPRAVSNLVAAKQLRDITKDEENGARE